MNKKLKKVCDNELKRMLNTISYLLENDCIKTIFDRRTPEGLYKTGIDFDDEQSRKESNWLIEALQLMSISSLNHRETCKECVWE